MNSSCCLLQCSTLPPDFCYPFPLCLSLCFLFPPQPPLQLLLQIPFPTQFLILFMPPCFTCDPILLYPLFVPSTTVLSSSSPTSPSLVRPPYLLLSQTQSHRPFPPSLLSSTRVDSLHLQKFSNLISMASESLTIPSHSAPVKLA